MIFVEYCDRLKKGKCPVLQEWSTG